MAVQKIGDNLWVLDISLGLQKKGDEQKRFRYRFEGTEAEANAAHDEYKRQLLHQTGLYTPVYGRNTIGELIAPHLEHEKMHKSWETYKEKKRILNGPIMSFFRNQHLDYITPLLVETYKKKRIKEIGKKHRMINIELIYFSKLWSWAHENGYAAVHPIKMKKLPYKKPLPRWNALRL
jgi:hypothetical protein